MADEPLPASYTYLRSGNTAVITGASSGIGKAASVMCAARGMNVWMVDVDKEELPAAREVVLKAAANGDSQKIEAVIADVSNLAAMEGLSDRVFADGGKCHFLFNNAGIMGGGGALTPMDAVQRVVGINTYGPIHGCLAFVPKMKESGEVGLIVNTGSKQGITCPPSNWTYNMSKAALKAYTEGLEHELRTERLESGGKLRAALLVPGWVNTEIMAKKVRDAAKAAGDDYNKDKVFFHEDKPASGAWMSPQVVDFMLEELDKERFYILCPDNDVNREVDNLRMDWAMHDLIENRPPLSRWHPDYKDKFNEYLEANKGKK
eukprot:CAMPEP_0197464532 /NCGR_PEP_ID=MMETSP1175-20131217/64070_1 /TAXON_ID=1003142 /ORGANISM="Triceratium dubium, Strain CCMP147" /LENGTH=318 /DNA_ID=CAMNT_0043000513 /DNA_START=418 /DNA_END=1374 /DNA_ORIENTATION=+